MDKGWDYESVSADPHDCKGGDLVFCFIRSWLNDLKFVGDVGVEKEKKTELEKTRSTTGRKRKVNTGSAG